MHVIVSFPLPNEHTVQNHSVPVFLAKEHKLFCPRCHRADITNGVLILSTLQFGLVHTFLTTTSITVRLSVRIYEMLVTQR
jgi:hypothetical protein